MCGIIGMINGHDVVPDLIAGLKILEYRGYDSAGVAVVGATGVERRRVTGRITELEAVLSHQPLAGNAGIAHTRWATHGEPSERNAHPHAFGPVTVTHNGIIENADALRAELVANGHRFESDTDSEVIPHLIATAMELGLDPVRAARAAIARLEGSFAMGALFEGHDDLVLAVRKGSPLVISLVEGGAALASDSMALAPFARACMPLEDGDVAILRRTGIRILDRDDRDVTRPSRPITTPGRSAEKGDDAHFMLKEIHEQPDAVAATLAGLRDEVGRGRLADLTRRIARGPRLTIGACGTSHHAAMIAGYWLESLAGLSPRVDIASEMRYRSPELPPNGVALFISQSGETADTLGALRFARNHAQHALALVNVAESTMGREADGILHTMAGPEIGVASTKAFTCQLTVLAAIAIEVGYSRGRLSAARHQALWAELQAVPALLEKNLPAIETAARELGQSMAGARSVLFMGRGTSYPLALEGALKLKEISYIHAEGIAAGELKHGPIALIDKSVPVVVVAPNDTLLDKTLSNLREVEARGAKIILVSESGSGAAVTRLAMPKTGPLSAPIVYALPLQLLAYHAAVALGRDVDRPRNLAKSVTVE